MDLSSEPVRRLGQVLYAVGGLLVLAPLIELAAGIGSLNAGAVPWRFGAMGLLSGALVLPLAGMAALFAAAVILEHRGLLRFLGITAAVMALLVLAAIVLFGLDALQMRTQVRQEAKRPFDLASLKAMTTYAMEALVLAITALAAFGASRKDATRGGRAKGDAGTLVFTQAEP